MESEFFSEYRSEDVSKMSKESKTVLALILANIVAAVVLVVAVVYSYKNMNTINSPISSPLDHLAKQFQDSIPDAYLPRSFDVEKAFYIPASDQGGRGTCWDFSTLYLLEAQYRAQGIKKGFLKENEYVLFSKQAFAAHLGNYCKAHTDVKVCKYGGFLNKNSTNDNQIEALRYFYDVIPNLGTSVVPESVCPYISKQDPVTDFQCDGLDEAINTNPIEFKLKQTKTVYDVRAIKQLLLEAQAPLGIGTPLTTIDYFVPCSDPNFADTDECLNKWTPCPDTTSKEYCATVNLFGSTADSTFLAVEDQMRMTQIGGHAMGVVGYNDDYLYVSRFSPPETVANLRGAFILHNSWSSQGHSVDYLMGRRTLENEESVCPNHNSPENWIPATLECLQQNQGDASKCSTDIIRIRGNGRTHGADLLKCKDKKNIFCTPDKKYVLIRSGDDVKATSLDNGFHEVHIAEISESSIGETVINRIPFWALSNYFAPISLVENHPTDCGFYALPYLALEIYRRRNWDLFDNMKVSFMEVEFSERSYLRSPASRKYNTKFLNESTKTLETPTFDGPIPFSVVYD